MTDKSKTTKTRLFEVRWPGKFEPSTSWITLGAALQDRIKARAVGIEVGQIWFPSGESRAKAREVVRIGEHLGAPHVFWCSFWLNCGHTDVSPIRIEGFRKWIRKHGATVKEVA